MKQLDLMGVITDEPDYKKHVHEGRTCGECVHIYKYAKWYKCQQKPRGWGYDIRLKHIACVRFKERTTTMEKIPQQ